MSIAGDVRAAGDVAADVIGVADVDDGHGGVFVFYQAGEGFAADAGDIDDSD